MYNLDMDYTTKGTIMKLPIKLLKNEIKLRIDELNQIHNSIENLNPMSNSLTSQIKARINKISNEVLELEDAVRKLS